MDPRLVEIDADGTKVRRFADVEIQEMIDRTLESLPEETHGVVLRAGYSKKTDRQELAFIARPKGHWSIAIAAEFDKKKLEKTGFEIGYRW